jgi:hypothetical protein
LRVGVERAFALGVDCWHDGEEVLEFMVVGVCFGDGLVEWVEEGWVVWPEGELCDQMREVECCRRLLASS